MQTGNVLWSLKGATAGVNVITSMRGDILIVSDPYGGSGTRAYRITPTGAELLWKRSFMDSTGDILCQDHLYVPGDVYKCLDLRTGEFNWKKALPGGVAEDSSPVLADGKIFTALGAAHQLTKGFGDLTYSLAMIKVCPDKYVEQGVFNPHMCMMTSPALAGGKLYLRLLDGIACYDLQEHGVYLDKVNATKDALTFSFKQSGGGLAGNGGVQITDASGAASPARAQVDGENIRVDINGVAVPFKISYPGKTLTGKNGLPVPAFEWNDARALKYRKCFDQTIMLASDIPLQQNGPWSKSDTFAIAGAKVTKVELAPQGKGVSLITDKTWKPGDTVDLTYACFSVDQGDARREKLTATVAPIQRTEVKFVKLDETTSGNWKGVYGTEGSVICADSAGAAPKGAIVTVTNKQDSIPWAPNAADTRYLLKSGETKDRTVTSWNAPEQFDIAIEVTDGKEHQVALYCMGWDQRPFAITVEVLDADTKAVLDTQTVKDYFKGKYLIWNLKGQVIVRLSNNVQSEGTAALASGVFFDPAPASK